VRRREGEPESFRGARGGRATADSGDSSSTHFGE
jgi:hypothetical protein